jgi:formate C-acetyltransferase
MAEDYSFSGCCNLDLHYHTIRNEWYVPAVEILCDTLGITEAAPTARPNYGSVDEILAAYYERMKKRLQEHIDTKTNNNTPQGGRDRFVLDALLAGACAEKCRYPADGGMDYAMVNFYFCGIATIADSLAAIDRLVFQEKAYTLDEFMTIVKDNFQGNEALQREITGYEKYGNDSDADAYAAKAGNILLDAVDSLTVPAGTYAVGGFYTLEWDHGYGLKTPATPDGRLAGTPTSENQSPVYGADKKGLTALLKSVAKLPLGRTACGGLNLMFSLKADPALLQPLLLSYFKLGGLHAGVTITDKKTLEDAIVNPGRYKSLTVRLYGFSEYFVSLPEWQQTAVLERTAY